jgi:hypothetical protein
MANSPRGGAVILGVADDGTRFLRAAPPHVPRHGQQCRAVAVAHGQHRKGTALTA